jgi:hypothetical protein
MFSPVYGGVRGGFIRNDRIGTFARASININIKYKCRLIARGA